MGAEAIVGIIGAALSTILGGASLGMQASNTTGKSQRLNNEAIRKYLGDIDMSMLSDDSYMSALLDWINNYGGDYGINMQDLLYSSIQMQGQKEMIDYQTDVQKDLMEFQQDLNSPSRQAQMMREAGLNPDLLGISGQSGIASQASSPSGQTGVGFNMSNAAQLGQTSAIEQANTINSIASFFTFGQDLAKSILDSGYFVYGARKTGAETANLEEDLRIKGQMFENLGLQNEELRTIIRSRNFNVIEGLTDYISKYYNDLGGKSFVDFESLNLGDLEPLFKSLWSMFDNSTRKEVEQVVLDNQLTSVQVASNYQKLYTTLQLHAGMADFRAQKEFKEFLTDFYSNLEPQLFAALQNKITSNRLQYEEVYNPELDAELFNSDNAMGLFLNRRSKNRIMQVDPILQGRIDAAMLKLEQIGIRYQTEIEDIQGQLLTENLKAFKDSGGEQQYLDNYYRIATGALPAGRADRFFKRLQEVGGVLAPIAYGAAAGLVGRSGKTTRQTTRRNVLYGPNNQPMTVDFDNMVFN